MPTFVYLSERLTDFGFAKMKDTELQEWDRTAPHISPSFTHGLVPEAAKHTSFTPCVCHFVDNFGVVGEAALAADWLTAPKTRRAGCATSRLDDGFPNRRQFEGQLHILTAKRSN